MKTSLYVFIYININYKPKNYKDTAATYYQCETFIVIFLNI